MSRSLIVNADDFGQSFGTNRGIITAYERGIVTSASLMVRWPAAVEAAAYAHEHQALSVGLHIDLGEWRYEDGARSPIYEVLAEGADEVAAEVERQLGAFRSLVGSDPTHVDSHQHVHHQEPLHSIAVELAGRLGIPLRSFTSLLRYDNSFHNWEAITVEGLLSIIAEIPPGVTELGCHPGLGADLESSYLHEREREVEALCDPRVRAAIAVEGIELRSFRNAFA
jgi:chitin disaccharide deacetylase